LRFFASTAALIALGGCASLGGNVKGSFSCAAPDGICAPSSTIDDRALAMISGTNGIGETGTIGQLPQVRTKMRAGRTAAASQRVPLAELDARRTQERVLRIVFQPYIDEQGRLHEASAIHAVVQNGEWQQQVLASATAIPDLNGQGAAAAPVSLAEALDRADPGFVDVSAIDPNLPDPAVVAAARARAADPVDAIRNDVAARLAPRAGRTPTPQPSIVSGQNAPAVTSAPTPASPSAMAPATIGAAAKETTTALGPKDGIRIPAAVAPSKTASGSEASARVKASPEYQVRAAEAEQTARRAAGAAELPDKGVTLKATVQAAGFPSAVPGDN
jgi:conjugal transfer pilus assembly protein TraV